LAAVSLEKGDRGDSYFAQPSRFVFGKSHVDAKVTGDLFEAVQPGPALFKPASGYRAAVLMSPQIELGGPWHFYNQFWEAHGLTHLNTLLAPEVEAGLDTQLSILVLIENPAKEAFPGKLTVELPKGWQSLKGPGDFEALPGGATPY
jgi:hypothetical protein